MNGNIFEIHAEMPFKGQFQNTLDVLNIILQQYINKIFTN